MGSRIYRHWWSSICLHYQVGETLQCLELFIGRHLDLARTNCSCFSDAIRISSGAPDGQAVESTADGLLICDAFDSQSNSENLRLAWFHLTTCCQTRWCACHQCFCPRANCRVSCGFILKNERICQILVPKRSSISVQALVFNSSILIFYHFQLASKSNQSCWSR